MRCLLVCLLLVGLVQPAHAIIITPDDAVRFDFDFTGQTPAAPYVTLQIHVETSDWEEGELSYLTLVDGGRIARDHMLLLGDPGGIAFFGPFPDGFTGVGYWLIESLSATAEILSATILAGVDPLGPPENEVQISASISRVSAPEPSTLALIAIGLAGASFARRRRSIGGHN
jgi:hypothetical protein